VPWPGMDVVAGKGEAIAPSAMVYGGMERFGHDSIMNEGLCGGIVGWHDGSCLN